MNKDEIVFKMRINLSFIEYSSLVDEKIMSNLFNYSSYFVFYYYEFHLKIYDITKFISLTRKGATLQRT